MGLAQTIFNSIKEKYFSVWDIISLIEQKPNNDLFDIGLFLGHINIEEHISIYVRDKFYNLHEIDPNFNRNPLGEIIDCLMDIIPFDSDEEQQKGRMKVRSKADMLFFSKQDIYNFKPIMDLGIIEKPQTQVVTLQSVQESRPDKYKFFLYKQPLFSIDECACIISDYDPLEIQKYPHNDIDEIAPDYSRAYSFISAAIEANKLNVFNYKVDADDFREYLASENIIIAGFNDQIAEPLYTEPTQAHAEFEKINASLELDLAIEKTKVKKLNEEIDHLKAEIAKWEASQAVQQDCLLSQIFDESATERYAPDLALSIKLWEHIYITNPKSDSHTNKAIKWLKNNTGYEVSKKAGSASKIREITTPFVSWGNLRDKNYKK